MEITKGEWKVENTLRVIDENGGGIAHSLKPNLTEAEANANLIVSAVNACVKVNKDNPVAVAEGIADLYEACIEADKVLLSLADAMIEHHIKPPEGMRRLHRKVNKALAKVE